MYKIANSHSPIIFRVYSKLETDYSGQLVSTNSNAYRSSNFYQLELRSQIHSSMIYTNWKNPEYVGLQTAHEHVSTLQHEVDQNWCYTSTAVAIYTEFTCSVWSLAVKWYCQALAVTLFVVSHVCELVDALWCEQLAITCYLSITSLLHHYAWSGANSKWVIKRVNNKWYSCDKLTVLFS